MSSEYYFNKCLRRFIYGVEHQFWFQGILWGSSLTPCSVKSMPFLKINIYILIYVKWGLMAVNSRHWHSSLCSFTIFMKMFGSGFEKECAQWFSDGWWGGGEAAGAFNLWFVICYSRWSGDTFGTVFSFSSSSVSISREFGAQVVTTAEWCLGEYRK